MKLNLNGLLENKKATAVMSVLIAVVMWFTVVLGIDTADEKTYHKIPVQLDAFNSTAGKPDIKPLISQNDPIEVSVTLSGKRSMFGYMSEEDIYVTAAINHIVTAGDHDLFFTVTDIHNKGFELVSITPPMETVSFDVWVHQPLDVTYELKGVTIPDDYVMGEVVLDPMSVELYGPDSMISMIETCVISLEFKDPLAKPFYDNVTMEFLNAQGEPVELNADFVKLYRMGGEEITLPGKVLIEIPILKKKTMPVTLAFTNAPDGFDTDSLVYSLSEDTILLAGPEDSIEPREEFSLGYIDMRELEPGYEKVVIVDDALPNDYENLNSVESITVTFPLSGYEVKSYTITNIVTKNTPAGSSITVDTRQIRVQIVGPASVLRTLTAADLVAEIDLDEQNPVNGQSQVAVEIQALEYDNVWAFGKYQAYITVRES